MTKSASQPTASRPTLGQPRETAPPYVVLALTLCLGLILGRRDASPTRRTWGAAVAGTYLLLVLANFAYLYPILAARVIPSAEWADRMWLRSWI